MYREVDIRNSFSILNLKALIMRGGIGLFSMGHSSTVRSPTAFPLAVGKTDMRRIQLCRLPGCRSILVKPCGILCAASPPTATDSHGANREK